MTSGEPLASVKHRSFNATLAVESSTLRVRLAGTADLVVQEQLATFLGAVHACATEHMVSRVLVDVNDLGFINSSCLKCLVTWIFKVHGDERARQYRIVFLTNHASPWQERSFHALSCMCTELVSIEG
jgi:hypothetical protein